MMERKREIKNYKRENKYNEFDSMTCPFAVVTIKIDITNIVNYCKVNKHHYATIAWVLMKAANQVDEMRVRNEDGKFYLYDKMNVGFALPLDNHVIGLFDCEMKDNLVDFIKEYEKRYALFKKEQKDLITDNGAIWCNCEPWFEITSIMPSFDKKDHTQEFIWDKIKEENNRFTINLTTMFHHGYFDGEHLARFIEILNEEISKFMGEK